MSLKALVINPGSTSTKVAVYDEAGEIFEKVVMHPNSELAKFENVVQEMGFRLKFILQAVEDEGMCMEDMDVVVGRGGLVRPVEGGVYRVNEQMLADLATDKLWGRMHASNLGASLAKNLADIVGVPSYIADPVTVDEMSDIAKVSGVPEISRQSMFHALNIRACIGRAASEIGKPRDECNFVAIHMGGGVSVVAILGGRCVDVNNGLLGMGPFSPQRAGALPIGDLVKMAYSGQYTMRELEVKLTKKSGLIAYLGTDDGREIAERISSGESKAEFIFRAMAYQIAKEAGASAAVLCGKVDGVIYTGGLSHSKLMLSYLQEHLGFLGRQIEIPGEMEMQALANAGLRVITGQEVAKEYKL